MEYEPDPRHAELIVKSLNLDRAKGVTTPSVKKRMEEVLATFPQLDASQTRLSQDRPDLAFSVKELARAMQNPNRHPLQTMCDWTCMVTVSCQRKIEADRSNDRNQERRSDS